VGRHPATRIFQAIRIEINNELEELRKGLLGGVEILKPNGRMVVISFHSLEDRIVKQTFDKFKRNDLGTVITKKPILPKDEEIRLNKRSRSAKLRVFEKK
jgi:16S rRNA (cytosine1402-N4)-methyltransferase